MLSWSALISPVLSGLKWVAEKLGLIYLGRILTQKRMAEESFRKAKKANENWEEIERLDDNDLAQRLRDSQR